MATAVPPRESSPESPPAIDPSAGEFAWHEGFPWAAWLASAVVHGSFVLVLSMIVIGDPEKTLLWLADDAPSAPLDDMTVEELPFDDLPIPGGVAGEASLGTATQGDEILLPGPVADSVGNVRIGPTNDGALVSAPSLSLPTDVAPLEGASEFAAGDVRLQLGRAVPLTNPLATRGGGLEGRTFENRLSAALAGGGTRRSEEAVEAGLAWLAKHQFADGGWRFDLEQHQDCRGECRDSGSYATTTAATGLALLSFLGAGYTHQQGPYAEVVTRGLYYLNEHMTRTTRGGDLRDLVDAQIMQGFSGGARRRNERDDTMYSHGIAALALTEAYAMTRDEMLREPAEQAIRFIINAQYEDGGWRYTTGWEPHTDGDMTVTGWQLMALKSGMLGGIYVPHEVWERAEEFIDGLSKDGGAGYGYIAGNPGSAATSAIGLLCRMIGGWPRESRPLLKGAAQLARQRPEANNIYFTYYAAQVLHHLGDSRWQSWNPKMREYLIDAQAQDGHEAGSWYFDEQHSAQGGRLYTTAMAVMTLEVYYRYMPIYGSRFVESAP